MVSSSGPPISWPSAARSRSCPPTIPSAPAARVSSSTIEVARSRGRPSDRALASITSTASGRSAAPARTARVAPYTRCTVGRPRRRSSSSMHGRSSWMSEYVCTISSEQASRHTATGGLPSPVAARHAAMQSPGRIRLPAVRSAYSTGPRSDSAIRGTASFAIVARPSSILARSAARNAGSRPVPGFPTPTRSVTSRDSLASIPTPSRPS